MLLKMHCKRAKSLKTHACMSLIIEYCAWSKMKKNKQVALFFLPFPEMSSKLNRNTVELDNFVRMCNIYASKCNRNVVEMSSKWYRNGIEFHRILLFYI